MGERCATFSEREGYIRVGERDGNGKCTVNLKYVKLEDVPKQVAIEHKRFENAVAKYMK